MDSKNKSTGISAGGLLQVALIILKLLRLIDISWWWVFAPSLAGIAICVICLIVMIVIDIFKK